MTGTAIHTAYYAALPTECGQLRPQTEAAVPNHRGEAYALQDERELVATDDQVAAVGRWTWLLEDALLQPLMVDRQAVLLPLEQLDGPSAPVDEDEHAAVCHLASQVLADNAAEAVEALSEVHDSLAPVVPRIRIQMKHGQPLRS